MTLSKHCEHCLATQDCLSLFAGKCLHLLALACTSTCGSTCGSKFEPHVLELQILLFLFCFCGSARLGLHNGGLRKLDGRIQLCDVPKGTPRGVGCIMGVSGCGHVFRLCDVLTL